MPLATSLAKASNFSLFVITFPYPVRSMIGNYTDFVTVSTLVIKNNICCLRFHELSELYLHQAKGLYKTEVKAC